MDILQKMCRYSDSFSESENKVYQTVLREPGLVEQSTITKLAKLSATSTSAVLRFCQSLGYNGYKDFRYDMIQYLHNRQAAPCPSDPVSQIAHIMSSALSHLAELDTALLHRLTEGILSADRVYTLGIYRSFLPAEKLRMNLEDQGILTLSSHDPIAFAHLAFTITPRSLVILFSVSGDSVNFQNFLDAVFDIAPQLWLVTCNANAKLSKSISNVIVLPSLNTDPLYPLDEHPVLMAFVELLSYWVSQKCALPQG